MKIILYDHFKSKWIQFTGPVKIYETRNLTNIPAILEEVDKEVNEKGFYAAGFITYEASAAFDPALKTKNAGVVLPLICFGIYNGFENYNPNENNKGIYKIGTWKADISKSKYTENIKKVKDYIRKGDTYQVNYTFLQYAEFTGEPLSFFTNLMKNNYRGFPAYIESDSFAICSASPELFFYLKDRKIITRPMKGTIKRGLTNKGDRINCQKLHLSEKNRAENLMIVDMIRNDLGRIALPGSIDVTKLYEIEKYPYVIQMTSTVNAEIPENNSKLYPVLNKLFPCASITGAPKVRTMEIIDELENRPRGIYTGSIGYYSPLKEAQFNVAIRTVTIDKKTNTAEYGVGGGIVWDSDTKDEYEECLTKAGVLNFQNSEFKLLETLLFEPGSGYFLRKYHLKRLFSSAKFFNFNIDEDKIIRKLNIIAGSFLEKTYRIRLLVDKNGNVGYEALEFDIASIKTHVKVAVANQQIDSRNVYLYHKTTNRSVYVDAKAANKAAFDVILWNENKEITESTIANIVLKIENDFFTPPVSCGLLAGTYRQYLIDNNKIKEKKLYLDDLKLADEIFLINSVRKWLPAEIDG